MTPLCALCILLISPAVVRGSFPRRFFFVVCLLSPPSPLFAFFLPNTAMPSSQRAHCGMSPVVAAAAGLEAAAATE